MHLKSKTSYKEISNSRTSSHEPNPASFLERVGLVKLISSEVVKRTGSRFCGSIFLITNSIVLSLQTLHCSSGRSKAPSKNVRC